MVDVSGYNTKDDVHYIKREIALSTNAEYLKQLVSQLSILSTGKDYIKVSLLLFDERVQVFHASSARSACKGIIAEAEHTTSISTASQTASKLFTRRDA